MKKFMLGKHTRKILGLGRRLEVVVGLGRKLKINDKILNDLRARRFGVPPRPRALSSPKRGWSGKTIFMTGIPKVSDLCEAQKSAQMTSPGGKGLLIIFVVAVSINTAPKNTSWRLNTTKPVTASAPRRLLSTP